MSQGMYGADPGQLRALGLQLVARNEPINEIRTFVVNALANTVWQGPARQKFEAEWNEHFNPALTSLEKAFGAAGSECMTRADALESAMGVAGAAS